MPKLILLRHGQSLWNKADRFTGWVDIPLSEEGMVEAINAGKKIASLPIDCIYTSSLLRAQMTAVLAMQSHHSKRTPILIHHDPEPMANWTKIYSSDALKNCLPMYADWHLNERYYGLLQGAHKQETCEQYGDAQVKLWRRSYDIAPPEGESLAMTSARTWPYVQTHILPELKDGRTVLISAHGNSLRSIVMNIEHLSKEAILEFEIPTGKPIIYDYIDDHFIKQSS